MYWNQTGWNINFLAPLIERIYPNSAVEFDGETLYIIAEHNGYFAEYEFGNNGLKIWHDGHQTVSQPLVYKFDICTGTYDIHINRVTYGFIVQYIAIQ